MKAISLVVILIAIAAAGCSWVSTSEQASLTLPESREDYIAEHPGGAFNEYILKGEITRGMNSHEVLASWGFPNVYLASRKDPREHWIYYVEKEDSRSYLIYTLNFDDELLGGWDINIKRFGDYSVNSGVVLSEENPFKDRTSISKQ